MTARDDDRSPVENESGRQAHAKRRRPWKAPSATVVDLAETTMAMGPGVSDAGIFS